MANTTLDHNLLIIGAGAHVDYGFPTSIDLTNMLREMKEDTLSISDFNDISNTFLNKNKIFMHKVNICKLAFNIGLIEEKNHVNRHDHLIAESFNIFLQSFYKARVDSIDKYLSKRKDYPDNEQEQNNIKWGKLVIVYFISNCERNLKLSNVQDDWIQPFISRYIENDLDSFFKNPPKIITFNYDRLLEISIYEHLIFQHGMSEDKAKSMVDSLPIIHVYGKLGCFTKWYEDNQYKHEFYKDAIRSIQVVGENRDNFVDAKIFKEMKNYFDNAQKIYFLGYGFDKSNNSKILSHFTMRGKDIFSTCVNIDRSKMNEIHQVLNIMPEYLEEYKTVKCLELIRNLEPLENPSRDSIAHIRNNFKGSNDSLTWMK